MHAPKALTSITHTQLQKKKEGKKMREFRIVVVAVIVIGGDAVGVGVGLCCRGSHVSSPINISHHACTRVPKLIDK